jgi:hypothetical protein
MLLLAQQSFYKVLMHRLVSSACGQAALLDNMCSL